MNEIWGFTLFSFTAFFSLLNPMGVIPVFISMTAGMDKYQRTRTAYKAILATFITLMLFALSGQVLFNFFGISVHSFRVAGGIIFFIMGYEMLQAKLSSVKINVHQEKQRVVNDISITPLAIPMLAGPGSITNSIVLMEDANTMELRVALIVVIAIICIITLISLLAANIITEWIGETGVTIMMRLMGLIMMVIAVEFFFKGMGPLLSKALSM